MMRKKSLELMIGIVTIFETSKQITLLVTSLYGTLLSIFPLASPRERKRNDTGSGDPV